MNFDDIITVKEFEERLSKGLKIIEDYFEEYWGSDIHLKYAKGIFDIWAVGEAKRYECINTNGTYFKQMSKNEKAKALEFNDLLEQEFKDYAKELVKEYQKKYPIEESKNSREAIKSGRRQEVSNKDFINKLKSMKSKGWSTNVVGYYENDLDTDEQRLYVSGGEYTFTNNDSERQKLSRQIMALNGGEGIGYKKVNFEDVINSSRQIKSSSVGDIHDKYVFGEISQSDAINQLNKEVGKRKEKNLIEKWSNKVLTSSVDKAVGEAEDYFGTLAEGDTVSCTTEILEDDRLKLNDIAEKNNTVARIGKFSVTFYDKEDYADAYTNVIENGLVLSRMGAGEECVIEIDRHKDNDWEMVAETNNERGWTLNGQAAIFRNKNEAKSSKLMKDLNNSGYAIEKGNLKISYC